MQSRDPFRSLIPGEWLMSWHIRSVRARILLLLLVPVLSLFGLYLFTTGIAGRDALNLARARALKTATSEPVSNFLGQLDTERVYSLIYLAAPSPGNLAKFRAQEAITGHVTAALRAALTSGSTLSNAPPAVHQASATLLHDAAGLPGLHSSVAARTVTRPQALATYDKLIGDSYLLLNQVILTETSTPIAAQALALEQIAKSGELLQQENVLVLSDMAARRFPLADQHGFARLVGARTSLYNQTLPELSPGYRAMYQRDVSPAAYAALTAQENAVIGSMRVLLGGQGGVGERACCRSPRSPGRSGRRRRRAWRTLHVRWALRVRRALRVRWALRRAHAADHRVL